MSVVREYRKALRSALSAEAKAYGFTLMFWGTGAITTAVRGSPGVAGAVAFVVGALAGMALVILASFGGPESTWGSGRPLRQHVMGAIHLASVAAAVAGGAGVAAAVPGHAFAFLAAAATAVILYQLVLGLEVAASIVAAGGGPGRRHARAGGAGRGGGRGGA